MRREEERRRRAEEEERRLQEEERKRREAELLRNFEEEKKRLERERAKEKKRREEEERKRKELEARMKREEEGRRRKEEEARLREEEERKRKEEETRRKEEERKRRKEEKQRREEKKRRKEEARRKREEAERKRLEAEQKKREEERRKRKEERKRLEEEERRRLLEEQKKWIPVSEEGLKALTLLGFSPLPPLSEALDADVDGNIVRIILYPISNNPQATDFKLTGSKDTIIGNVHFVQLRPFAIATPCIVNRPEKYLKVEIITKEGKKYIPYIRNNTGLDRTVMLGFWPETEGAVAFNVKWGSRSLFTIPITIYKGLLPSFELAQYY